MNCLVFACAGVVVAVSVRVALVVVVGKGVCTSWSIGSNCFRRSCSTCQCMPLKWLSFRYLLHSAVCFARIPLLRRHSHYVCAVLTVILHITDSTSCTDVRICASRDSQICDAAHSQAPFSSSAAPASPLFAYNPLLASASAATAPAGTAPTCRHALDPPASVCAAAAAGGAAVAWPLAPPCGCAVQPACRGASCAPGQTLRQPVSVRHTLTVMEEPRLCEFDGRDLIFEFALPLLELQLLLEPILALFGLPPPTQCRFQDNHPYSLGEAILVALRSTFCLRILASACATAPSP